MKRLFSSLVLCLSLASCALSPALIGCRLSPAASVTGDPVAVNSEKTIAIARDTIDAFLKWEKENRSFVSPDVHAAAQAIRAKAPDQFRNARAVLRAYKTNRTPEQKALLDTWLATLSELARVASATSTR
jgi:hypothetical protein